ncbi:putative A ORF E [Vaccinia virus Copenhagen]|uniref:Uncharacterized 18.2 kDa protein n=2 Tax=Orthopoxvirus TaxID=10242 RepID=YVAE_VACCC|nr:RecName: Full=Uncharacterized 18.2 kDa protein [Vaccinia virus Copenhagen]AAA48130.1 putative A ORF E [Vaccinia virus Copenhagen]WDR17276.1 putative A ORF E [Vaccinia virus Copenhagen]WDR17486.1 putative A ORF E [Vaccinia virus Copenhagen]
MDVARFLNNNAILHDDCLKSPIVCLERLATEFNAWLTSILLSLEIVFFNEAFIISVISLVILQSDWVVMLSNISPMDTVHVPAFVIILSKMLYGIAQKISSPVISPLSINLLRLFLNALFSGEKISVSIISLIVYAEKIPRVSILSKILIGSESQIMVSSPSGDPA